jgi:membrane protein
VIKEFAGLLRATWVEYERDRARYLAVAMIYYAGVSLIPLLVLLLSGLGLLVRFWPTAVTAEQDVLAAVEGYVGPDGLALAQSLLDKLQQESYIAMFVGLAGIVFTSTNLFKQLRLAFRAIWHHEPVLTSGSVRAVVRTTVLEQAIAFVMVLGGGALLLAALVLVGSTRWLNEQIFDALSSLPLLSKIAGYLVTATGGLVLAIVTFWPLFKFLPPVRIPWHTAWPATLLSAVAWVLAIEFLSLYGRFFGDSTTGAIGGLFAALLWMNTVSQVLFFGAELCKVQESQHPPLAVKTRGPSAPSAPTPSSRRYTG